MPLSALPELMPATERKRKGAAPTLDATSRARRTGNATSSASKAREWNVGNRHDRDGMAAGETVEVASDVDRSTRTKLGHGML